MCSLYLSMKRYSFYFTFTPTAYATNDTTIIHHVYKPDFAVYVPFFHDRKLGHVCHHIGGRVRSSFLSGQWRGCYENWPKCKLDRALSDVWLGRHDQTALILGRGKNNVEAATLQVLNLWIRTFIVMCTL